MYDIDSLIKKFKKDGKKSEKEKEFHLKRFKEDYPNEYIPEYMIDDFNLCFALHSICLEIKKLNDRPFPEEAPEEASNE